MPNQLPVTTGRSRFGCGSGGEDHFAGCRRTAQGAGRNHFQKTPADRGPAGSARVDMRASLSGPVSVSTHHGQVKAELGG